MSHVLTQIDQSMHLEPMRDGNFEPQITHICLMPHLVRVFYMVDYDASFRVDLSVFPRLVAFFDLMTAEFEKISQQHGCIEPEIGSDVSKIFVQKPPIVIPKAYFNLWLDELVKHTKIG